MIWCDECLCDHDRILHLNGTNNYDFATLPPLSPQTRNPQTSRLMSDRKSLMTSEQARIKDSLMLIGEALR